jgi:hypothetical protein
VDFCKDWQPDLIIFAKANGIDVDVFEECKKIAPVCYWFADPLSTYKNEEFYEKTKASDFFVCDKNNVLEKSREYNEHCFIVADGFDQLLERPRDFEKEFNVSFIGNLYGDRKDKIGKIEHKIHIISNAYGEKHSECVAKSKINLNFCTADGPSDRVFKVLAAGGFLLTDDWVGRKEFFEDGKDLVIFKDFDDLNRKISYYLENQEERNAISATGCEKVQQYNRRQWAKNIIHFFDSLEFAPRNEEEKKETVLIAGPWVGEFGWELFAWHGYVRSMSRFYDKTICVSTKNSKFLYEDFCDEFLAMEPEGEGLKDSFFKSGLTFDARLLGGIVKSLKLNVEEQKVTFFTPRRIGDPPRSHFSEKMQLGVHYLGPIYKKFSVPSGRQDIVIHARSRKLRQNDNWSREKWETLVDKLSKSGYNIVSIGLKEESIHIRDTIDKRECDQNELVEILSNAVCIFGPSSGAMHLAALCGCPQVVWGDQSKSLNRYYTNWNPLQTKVLFLGDFLYHPSAKHVYEEYTKWSNNG